VIFLGDFSIVKIFLVKLLCYLDSYFKYVMFGKYNGFASKARVSAFMYFLVVLIISDVFNLKRQCQPQCICLHFTLKVMECQQITIINISLVLCRYNSVKMSKYNHRMVEIYDGLKTKTWITLPMLLFEHCLSAQCIVVDIVPLTIYSYSKFNGGTHAGNGDFFWSRNACVIFKPIREKQLGCCYRNNNVAEATADKYQI
jgi:hypothetical protein